MNVGEGVRTALRHRRVILIGGTSHAGKSTLAGHLAGRLGWACRSTDKLARHPGRPWAVAPNAVPPHVRDHYLGLSSDEQITSVLAHYRTMRPLIEAVVAEHAGDLSTPPLVLEGSALLPETVAALRLPGISASWLISDDGLITARILAESRYDEADAAGRLMIDKFAERARRFNRLMSEQVAKVGLTLIPVTSGATLETLTEQCLQIGDLVGPSV